MSFILYNATGKPLYMESGNSLVRIPEVTAPQIVGHFDMTSTIEVGFRGLGASSDTLPLLQFAGEQVEGVLNLPSEEANVFYVVNDDILTRLSFRDDFVGAAAVRSVKRESDDSDVQILVGVTRIGLSELSADEAYPIPAEADN
jgi:hypothetical protein